MLKPINNSDKYIQRENIIKNVAEIALGWPMESYGSSLFVCFLFFFLMSSRLFLLWFYNKTFVIELEH